MRGPSSSIATRDDTAFELNVGRSGIRRFCRGGRVGCDVRIPQATRLPLQLVGAMPFRILAADHTGITVSNLEHSLAFWRDVLGFEFSHMAHQTGELAREITGVEGAEIKLAVLKAPGGHKIELLEYLAPPDRKRQSDRCPCDLGHVHVALIVDNVEAILQKVAASGWKAAGQPQILKSGPNAGKRVVYVRDADGTTIEFMGMPKQNLSTDFAD